MSVKTKTVYIKNCKNIFDENEILKLGNTNLHRIVIDVDSLIEKLL